MDSGLTTGDLALMTERNNGIGDGGGSAFIWIFALLILCMGMFNGGGLGGGNGYAPQYATQDFVQNGFNFNDLQQQHWGLFEAGNRNTSEIVSAVKESEVALAHQNGLIQTSATAIAGEQAKCCCETQKAIMNSDMLGMQNTNAINNRIADSEMKISAQIQRLYDKTQEDKIEALQNQVNNLNLQSAMCGVVRYPTQMSYCAGQAPFCNGCNGCNM